MHRFETPIFYVARRWAGILHASIEYGEHSGTVAEVRAGKAKRREIRISEAMMGLRAMRERYEDLH